MNRRVFLAAVLSSLAWGPSSAREDGKLLDLFTAPADARVLGRVYLASLGRPIEAQKLEQEIRSSLSGAGSLRSQIAVAIRNDYERDRVACVDGWILSLTEARLCALAALA